MLCKSTLAASVIVITVQLLRISSLLCLGTMIHGCLACVTIGAFAAALIEIYAIASVGDEEEPAELKAAPEKTKEQKLGIVFKTVNKVRPPPKPNVLTALAQASVVRQHKVARSIARVASI